MNADFPVVLDANVIVPAALRDLLLRLAEKRFFLPKWSDQIIAEMIRTLENKLKKTPEQTTHLHSELRTHFGDAWVDDCESIIPTCSNHEKDRHVLAAAIKSHAELIVTFNLRHFPPASLAPWSVDVSHPDEFLIDLFYLNPELMVHTLHEQATDLDRTLDEQLRVLAKGLPKFVQLISETLVLEPPPTSSRKLPAKARKKTE